jgi:hypothetical protein
MEFARRKVVRRFELFPNLPYIHSIKDTPNTSEGVTEYGVIGAISRYFGADFGKSSILKGEHVLPTSDDPYDARLATMTPT